MAILGQQGSISLMRDRPDPFTLTSNNLETTSRGLALEVEDPGFWTGDKVRVTDPQGLPLEATPGDLAPPTNDGLGMFGPPPAVLGGWADHRADDVAPMYRVGDDVNPFWGGKIPVQTTRELYIHRDGLDRVRFYLNERDARQGKAAGQVKLFSTQFTHLLLEGAWTDADGWRQQASLTGWAVETDPTNLDVTAIGEEFGSYVRSLVRGAGSFTGWIDNREETLTCSDTVRLARLALMAAKGGTAEARFTLKPGSEDESCPPNPPLYYRTKILLGRTSLTVGIDQPDSITAEFVATEEMELVSDFEDI